MERHGLHRRGLSPRVRGNHAQALHGLEEGGSIPACAGEPRADDIFRDYLGVYPRVCGGTPAPRFPGPTSSGLSPRVRGNPAQTALPHHGTGSIPACAGEPVASHLRLSLGGVYPRVCGGTLAEARANAWNKGLSPRVRGNPVVSEGYNCSKGSIPACAGEPDADHPRRRSRRVYPRVCGGTKPPNLSDLPAGGLSPRVRGNQCISTAYTASAGSIPACAGEPKRCRPAPGRCRVYPRVCGGTFEIPGQRPSSLGLSPRVRGNPRSAPRRRRRARSIPACAGEPAAPAFRPPGSRVYPRVCGGTGAVDVHVDGGAGLSPRVRGNPHDWRGGNRRGGSIPACAGEPGAGVACRAGHRVYPRVCGGTSAGRRGRRRAWGLSPRVRGNPRRSMNWPVEAGSIPACAGEPGPNPRVAYTSEVYPRVCGGTRQRRVDGLELEGLSPRVRGNQPLAVAVQAPVGSIPACAGEPLCS